MIVMNAIVRFVKRRLPLFAALLLAPAAAAAGAAPRPAVAATIFPVYDIARNVAGPDARVELILPPGASPHLFEFSPRQLAPLADARLIFAVGHGLDDWADRVAGVAKGARVVVVDRGVALKRYAEERGRRGDADDRGQIDPHYWLDFGNAERIAGSVAESLAALDPAHAGAYRARAAAYGRRLSREERRLRRVLAPYRGERIMTFHDAWYYFADDFGLKVLGTFEPSAGEDPTPRRLAGIQDRLAAARVKTVFLEPQFSSAALRSFARDNGLRVATLDPLGGVEGRRTYLELMAFDAGAVRGALARDAR
jgi:ABC-type Zn uptake system ZnuABC Zn-binding protein ZnuA